MQCVTKIAPVASVIELPESDGSNCTVFPLATSAAATAWRRLSVPGDPGSPVVFTMNVLPASAVAGKFSAALSPKADANARARRRFGAAKPCTARACRSVLLAIFFTSAVQRVCRTRDTVTGNGAKSGSAARAAAVTAGALPDSRPFVV